MPSKHVHTDELECMQEDKFDHLHETLQTIAENQRQERIERRESEKKLMSILEKLADQGARMEHVEEHIEDHTQWLKRITDQVHDLELNQASSGPNARLQLNDAVEEFSRKLDSMNTRFEKLLGFHKIATGKKALYVYGGILFLIIFGTASDLWNHWGWVKEIWHYWRG